MTQKRRAVTKRAPKNRKKRSKGATVLLSVLFTVLLTAVFVCLYLLVFMVSYVNGDSKINLEEYKENQDQTTIIYAYDTNNEVTELSRLHGEQNRVWVTYSENPDESVIPQNLANAYIALEDKRFYDHGGVDWFRTLSSAVKYHFKQGGSTLTQQLIKNLTGENGKTVNRKFYEILSALNLEKNASKQTILEAYMNTVYMSHGCYGVQTASEKYFGKNVQDLNLAECASLAAITQSPSKYDPLIHPEENKKRQKVCLDNMLKQGKITEDQYNEAINYTMVFTNSEGYVPSENLTSAQQQTTTTIQSYYVDYVIQKVIADLMDKYGYTKPQASTLIYSGGLRIYSAVDMNVQNILENVYVNRISFPSYNKNVPDAQSAMTIMDYSGRVLGMIGGAGEKTENRGLNRAANSYRQPGSSIKPLSVYTPAIEEKYAYWSTRVKNYGIPHYYRDGGVGPVNYGNDPGSPDSYVNVQKAICKSYNTVPAQLLKKMGYELSFKYANGKFRLDHLYDVDKNASSLAVGGTSQGVSTLQMAAAYATFGNGGKYYDPYCYYKVTNSSGTMVYLQHDETDGDQIMSQDTADIMNELLQTVVTDTAGEATARNYGLNNMKLFAKTGTTTEDKDRWFCGGSPYYVAAVWYGCDTPKQLSNYVSGNPAGKIFDEVLNRVHKGLASKDFTKFSSIVEQKEYCTKTGLLAGSGCSSRATGWFSKSNMPGYCTSCSGGGSKDGKIEGETKKTTDGSTKPAETTKAAAETTKAPEATKAAEATKAQ